MGPARILVAAVALAALAAGHAPSPASSQVTAAAAPSKQAAPAKPPVRKRLIPFPQSRKRDMAGYSKRHYGQYRWRLTDPEVIVIHYAEAGSIGAIRNTFAPNRPDVEYHELPGVCSHYAVSAKGLAYRFVPDDIRCRHTVGLNHVALGIEHVGFSDSDVIRRKAELKGSLALTQWLRCRHDIGIKNVIGHAESLSSPFYKELDPDFRGRTHSDLQHASMQVYRRGLRRLGPC